MTKKYVIKDERMKNYLWSLGFDYNRVEDKLGNQKYIYLFIYNDDLKEAMDFFTKVKLKRINKE